MTTPVLSPLAEADQRIREALARKPDGIIEAVAAEAGASPLQVLRALQQGQCLTVTGDLFDRVWEDMTGWGAILLIVATPDIVLEVKGALVPGQHGQGYFNVHGDSPIGGHIKASACVAIGFVDRTFHGRRSCSVQFFNAAGEAMFKVFVPRDRERALLPEPLARFELLRARLTAVPGQASAFSP